MMQDEQNKVRVIVDTNLWISYLIGHKVGRLISLLEEPIIELIVTQQLIDELFEVTHRPKFSKYFLPEDTENLKKWLSKATFIELGAISPRCRDPKDDYLLELAVQARAIFLVSGDKDLLEIGNIEGCRIMTISQFEDEMVTRIL